MGSSSKQHGSPKLKLMSAVLPAQSLVPKTTTMTSSTTSTMLATPGTAKNHGTTLAACLTMEQTQPSLTSPSCSVLPPPTVLLESLSALMMTTSYQASRCTMEPGTTSPPPTLEQPRTVSLTVALMEIALLPDLLATGHTQLLFGPTMMMTTEFMVSASQHMETILLQKPDQPLAEKGLSRIANSLASRQTSTQ